MIVYICIPKCKYSPFMFSLCYNYFLLIDKSIDVLYASSASTILCSIKNNNKNNKKLSKNSHLKTETHCKWCWDIIMSTCPNSFSKLLILELPAGQWTAYPDWALLRGCGSVASITSLGHFLAETHLLSSDWQQAITPSHMELCQRSLQRLCSFNPSWSEPTWHPFISVKCSSGEALSLPQISKLG